MLGQRHQLTAAQRRQIRMAFSALAQAIGATLNRETTYRRLSPPTPEDRRFAHGEMPLPIGKNYAVPPRPMFKVIVKPFLGTQALNKLQIRFAVLRAEIPQRIILPQLEAPALSDNPVLLEHLVEDLRH
ncbi:hypothetical protein D3C76_1050940 [compost metagenome]